MRWIAPFCLVCCLSILPTGCEETAAGGLGKEFSQAIAKADAIELISINPNRLKGGDYHGWQELGRTKITKKQTQRTILTKINDAINKSDGTVAACFNPRHAVLARHNGKTYEVVICFECLSLITYVDGKRVGDETITQTHADYFNQLLKDAKLPIAD